MINHCQSEWMAFEELTQFFRRFEPLHARGCGTFTRLGLQNVRHLAPPIRGEMLVLTGLMDTVCPTLPNLRRITRYPHPMECGFCGKNLSEKSASHAMWECRASSGRRGPGTCRCFRMGVGPPGTHGHKKPALPKQSRKKMGVCPSYRITFIRRYFESISFWRFCFDFGFPA